MNKSIHGGDTSDTRPSDSNGFNAAASSLATASGVSASLLRDTDSSQQNNMVSFDASSGMANATKEELFQEVVKIRKKYDELVAFTVQLTAQRDGLMNDVDKSRQQLKQAKLDAEMAKAQCTVDNHSPGLRHRKSGEAKSSGAHTAAAADLVGNHAALTASPKQFTVTQLAIAAIVFYLLGRFYQTAA